MIFGTLDSLIQRCEEHLNLTGTRSTDIENYFVQFLLVRICAEYEIRITTLVHRRCARTTDVHLKAFADDHAEYVCRRFSITNIRRTLARFGDDYAKAFHNQVMSGKAHIAWDNIYTNRVAVAHKTPTPMSFGDLKQDYQDSLIVLDSIVVALGLNVTEIQDLK